MRRGGLLHIGKAGNLVFGFAKLARIDGNVRVGRQIDVRLRRAQPRRQVLPVRVWIAVARLHRYLLAAVGVLIQTLVN